MSFKKYLVKDSKDSKDSKDLLEASLQRTNLRDNPERYDLFLDKIRSGKEFELVPEKGSSEKVKIDKDFLKHLSMNPTEIPQRIPTSDGPKLLSDFQKTAEFGSNSGSGGGAVLTSLVESAQCAYLAMLSKGLDMIPENISKVQGLYDVTENINDLKSMDHSWTQSSIRGALKIQSELDITGMKFHRGSGLVSKIEDHFKKMNKAFGSPFSNINKFTPADIWLVRDENVIKNLEKTDTLEGFRQFLIKEFERGNLIGISLKKIVSDSPPWKILNLTKSVDIKYTGKIISKKGIFGPGDSIDIYIEYKSKSQERIQFRDTSGHGKYWQGEVKGSAAAGGKVGYGFITYVVDRYTGFKFPDNKTVQKKVNSRDQKFLKDLRRLVDLYYGTCTDQDFNRAVLGSSDQYLYSKYLGLLLIDIIEHSRDKDFLISELVNYAKSETSMSAPFIKLGS